MKARLYFRQKHVYLDRSIFEMKVWIVPKSAHHPEGYKYSMVYINRFRKKVIGYDNAHGKGHHRHDSEGEKSFEFLSIEGLMELFLSEVQDLRRTVV